MASQVPSSSFNEDASLDLIESGSFGKGLLRCFQAVFRLAECVF